MADFVAGGSGNEATLRANEEGWNNYTLWPRVLVNVRETDPGVTIFVSPMGIHCLVDPAGELASAAAARHAGLGYDASPASSINLEETAEIAPDCRWLQVCWLRDRDVVADLIQRAQAAGYTGICLTVDAPVDGARLRDRRNGFAVSEGIRFANLERYGFAPAAHSTGHAVRYIVDEVDPSVTWQDLAWLANNATSLSSSRVSSTRPTSPRPNFGAPTRSVSRPPWSPTRPHSSRRMRAGESDS